MGPQRAFDIVSAINDRCFFTIEIRDKVKSLKGITLAEMIEAAETVREHNKAAEARPHTDGKYSITVVPDDRLIAAAYCMEHYPVSTEAIIVLPMSREERFWNEANRKALAIVPLKETDEEITDD